MSSRKTLIERAHPPLKSLLEAQLLLASLLNVRKEEIIAHSEVEVDEKTAVYFDEHVKKRAAGYPLAYIVGKRAFCRGDFFVNEEVLIPRPESELIVEAIEELTQKDEVFSLIDVGTGSGCLAISIAEVRPCAIVTAIDISKTALLVAAKNAKQHGVEERFTFYKSNLLAGVVGKSFDYVIANLPYIGENDFVTTVEPDVQKYEPRSALIGGKNGLELYDQLFAQIAHMEPPPKAVIVEIGYGQRISLEVLVKRYFHTAQFTWKRDLLDIDRTCIISLAVSR